MLHPTYGIAGGGHSKAACCETKKFTTALKLQIILLSLLVTCAAALFCLPAKNAYAGAYIGKPETVTTTINGVTYTYEKWAYNDSGLPEEADSTIAGYDAWITVIASNSVSSVVVPEKIDGATVVTIGLVEYDGGIQTNSDGTIAGTSCEIGPNISYLDISNCSEVSSFYSENNNLTTLRAVGVNDLTIVCCQKSTLSNLILSDLNLKYLYCADNNLSSLSMSNLRDLEILECNNNNLTSLDISSFSSLRKLKCQNNKINNTTALETWLAQDGHEGQVLPQKATGDSGNTGNAGNSGNNNTSATVTGAWKHNSKGWWYAYSNGTYATGMKKIGNATYYFDNKGWMKTGWQHAAGNSDWYYFNKSGAMKTGWLKSGGKWYYLNPSDGKMKTGFYNVGKTRYYSNGSGVMKTGWQKISNSWYYFASSGAMKTGWAKTGGKWYYLNSDGKMQTGKQVISGKTYFLNSSGAMRTSWIKDGSAWRYANKSGAMQTSKWIGNYYVDANGVMLTSQWVKTNGKEYYVNKAGKWTGAKR